MYQSPRYPDVERTRFQEIREQRREFAVEHDETTSKPPSGRVNRAHRGLHFPCSRAVELHSSSLQSDPVATRVSDSSFTNGSYA